MQDPTSPRITAITALRRAASVRDQREATPPVTAVDLARSRSLTAREAAMAKLTGVSSTSASPSPTPGPSEPRIHSPAPRLSEIGRRHAAKTAAAAAAAQAQAQTSAESSSILEDYEGMPDSPVIPPTPSSAQDRAQARSNLMRKLSSGRTAQPPRIRRGSADGGQLGIPDTPAHHYASSAEESETLVESSAPDSSPTVDVRASAAPSEFRAYRHTLERDRDSAFARLIAEDAFELDYGLLTTPSASGGSNGASPLLVEGSSPGPPQQQATPSTFPQSPHLPSGSSPGATPIFASPLASTSRNPEARMISVDGRDDSSVPVLLASSSTAAASRALVSALSSPPQSTLPSFDGLGIRNSEDSDRVQPPRVPPKPYAAAPEPGYRFPSPPSSSGEHARHRTPNGSTAPLLTRARSTSLAASVTAPLNLRNGREPSPRQQTPPMPRGHTGRTAHGAHLRANSSSAGSSVMSRTPPSSSSIGLTPDSSDSDTAGRLGRSHSSRKRRLRPTIVPDNSAARDRVAAKLNAIVASASPDSSQPSALDRPPRRLLLHAPVLQVVNSNTVKDRYLFLFNDVLLIAKPLVEEDPVSGEVIPPTLATQFLVKSVVELSRLKITAQRDDDRLEDDQRKRNPNLLAFVDRFGNNPSKAISQLITRGGITNDAATIANLLFKTPELNRSQIGAYLSQRDSKHVLKAYVERFRLGGVRVEEALRIFLATLRLPNDLAAAEHLLHVFASCWATASGMSEVKVTQKLVIAMMELNDFLHSGIDDETGALGHLFGFPNPAITVEDFIGAFRTKDPLGQFSDDNLTRIYLSVRRERLQQAADNGVAAATPDIAVTLSPARLPSRLTYKQATEPFTISLPAPDPRLTIKLVGADLRMEPSTLNFGAAARQSFTVTGLALGHKTLLMLKLGPHATYYSGLLVNKSFGVERAFMRHTFQIAFVNHLGVKRKYMFSMTDADTRSGWLHALHARIEACREPTPAPTPNRAQSTAHTVAMQVLRDALIAPDPQNAAMPTAAGPAQRRPLGSNGVPAPPATRPTLNRSNSFSKTYAAGLGRHEQLELGTPKMSSPMDEARRPSAASGTGRLQATSQTGAKTGTDIVVVATQNSLLPSVLALMHNLSVWCVESSFVS